MPRVPGMFNGGVPKNIVWDETDPPVKNMCTGLPYVHAKNCDGQCGTTGFMTELEVKLYNEQLEWQRVGMTPRNIIVDGFKISMETKAMKLLLVELGHLERFNTLFQECLLAELTMHREENQEIAKRQQLGLPGKPPLLGPDGSPV